MDEELDVVFAALLDRGQFYARVEAMPEDLKAFRSELRACGRRKAMRVRTSVTEGMFFAYWPEHVPTPMQIEANRRVMRTMFTEDAITYDEAFEQVRREQIRAV